jgi:hypothetical protein
VVDFDRTTESELQLIIQENHQSKEPGELHFVADMNFNLAEIREVFTKRMVRL